MRLRIAKKVYKKHTAGAYYRQSTLDKASSRLKLTERLVRHAVEAQPVAKPKPPQAVQAGPDYSKMSVTDLKAAAKEQGLKGYSKLKKAELLDLLQK